MALLGMPSIAIKFVDRPGDGDGAWPDLADKVGTDKLHHVKSDIHVAGLAGGMASGKPSVALRIGLEDGTTVLAETSLALFLTAADALKGRFGDPRT